MVRESCLDCKFKNLPRYSDITLGDFWGIKPEEVRDIDKGISLCFINSDKGKFLMEEISNRVESIDKTLDDAKTWKFLQFIVVHHPLRTEMFS